VPLERSTRVLEYGAGTGLVSEALRDDVGPITLADTSAGMRSVIAAKVDAGALAGARVWDLDLSTDAAPDERFDLIVTVMTLHHITDLPPVLDAFARMLAAGGHLCIVDLDHEDGAFHGAGFVGHHGFERPALAQALAHAGFADVRFTDCHEMVRGGGRYGLFLATCRPGRSSEPR
jgi:predicted TPR repeat methyltransferase